MSNIICIDIGFGYSKVLSPDQQVYRFSSQIASGHPKWFPQFSEDDSLVLWDNDDLWWVGTAAERGEGRSGLLGKTEGHALESDVFRLLNKTAMALATFSVQENDEFRVVTGLPNTWYMDGRLHEILENVLWGEHRLRARINGENMDRTIHVTEVEILPQAFGSWVDYTFDESGQRRVEPQRIGVIDIGFYTTDFLLVDGNTISHDGTFHRPIGFNKAVKQFYAGEDEYEVDRYLRREGIENAEAYRDVGREVTSSAESAWYQHRFREPECILLAGGAAEPLADSIDLPNIVLLDEPGFANVRGYRKYAGTIARTLLSVHPRQNEVPSRED